MAAQKHASPFYRKLLLTQLAERQRENPRYSLRSFAKFLGIQPPTLASVLSGKRALPAKYGPSISTKLRMDPLTRTRFLKSLRLRKNRNVESQTDTKDGDTETLLLKEASYHKIISQWEHYAILSLADTRGFRSEPQFIAERLGISKHRAAACIQNLLEVNLLRQNDVGRLVKLYSDVATTEDVVSNALQESHKDSLALAHRKLETLEPLKRDFSSGVLAMPAHRLPEAKELIRNFRKSFYDLLEDGDGEDVFQLCVQFFPLTQLEP